LKNDPDPIALRHLRTNEEKFATSLYFAMVLLPMFSIADLKINLKKMQIDYTQRKKYYNLENQSVKTIGEYLKKLIKIKNKLVFSNSTRSAYRKI